MKLGHQLSTVCTYYTLIFSCNYWKSGGVTHSPIRNKEMCKPDSGWPERKGKAMGSGEWKLDDGWQNCPSEKKEW
jgi:hypothetical protein